MNLLIADSGSTKTEWAMVRADSKPGIIQSAGLNPWYRTISEIADEISARVFPYIPPPDHIVFYGAGCTGPEMNDRVRQALDQVFGMLTVEVYSDLMGAARALCGHREGIACILGTGSNSCRYDGNQITDQVPTLGFILGDEGSAGWFGRKLLQDYFYRELPDELCRLLEKHHDMSREAILNKIYHHKNPNTFIASFTGLLAEFENHPYVEHLLHEGFTEFIERHVMKYESTGADGRAVPVGFTGSVAWNHRLIISSILQLKGLKPGTFLRSPMEGLYHYHAEERKM